MEGDLLVIITLVIGAFTISSESLAVKLLVNLYKKLDKLIRNFKAKEFCCIQNMAKRKFAPNRLYKLFKWLVIIISLSTGLLAIFLFNNIADNKILRNYEKVCSKYPDDPSVGADRTTCMIFAYDEIERAQNLMVLYFTIAVGLPIFFFGGVALLKYLFPEKEKN